MKVWRADILEEIIIIEPDVFRDERGFFLETYQLERYRECGINKQFVQDNISFSTKGVLRGLHYQYPHEQAKLVQVIVGEIFDVVVYL
jgi:dTDP-4-dehydrorhamnose 3,5-epimerase